jgi:outer membrane protein assembly factor BamB
LLIAAILSGRVAHAQVNVYTRSYDNIRSGANLNETILTPANVNTSQFGKLFTVNVDSEVYAQPLYVSNLNIGGSIHNVVYVATMNDSVYAIDGDNGAVLWKVNLGKPIVTSEVEGSPNIALMVPTGILSTPVIDPTTNTMYVVHGSEGVSNGAPSYQFHLNALNILTGARSMGAVNIAGSYSTPDLTAPIVFNGKLANQRPSLALANGNVYIAFASHNDNGHYHGWIFAYSASTLTQTAVYSDTTTGNQGGIWMAGSAPSIDSAGNLYFNTGNGSFGVTPNNLVQTGSSFIKLSPTLQLLDYFTPYNSAVLNAGDQDLGASGLLLVPNAANPQGPSQFVLGGGKQGRLYLADPNDLGKFNSSQDQVLQEFQGVYGYGSSHIHGTPVYFNSAINGPSFYVWGENDYLRGFQFNGAGGLIASSPFATSTMTAPTTHIGGAMPGGFLSVSANGGANGGANGIVWASTPYLANANSHIVQGVLYAFDANTLHLLWSDKSNDTRDEIGFFAKYVPPVVANGKVYVATFGPLATGNVVDSGQLVVYGLLNSAPPSTVPAYSQGFSASQLQLNGAATLKGTSLRITDGQSSERGSAFFTKPVNVEQFTTSFDFQLTNPLADGFTFTIQGNGPKSLGGQGSGLGYSGIGNSVAVKFDLYGNAGEGPDSTGLFLNGVPPNIPAIDLSSSGVDLHSGDPINAQLTYDGSTLTVVLTDSTNNATATQSYGVDIPSIVGGDTAYVGFTGGSGHQTAVQNVLDWTYMPTGETTSGGSQ